ncbi:MAG: hypothetical protein OXC11_08610 [Rhodospirillales bacterium]|nr:hypothetical protein [Rhodospirillales bacterium]
MENDTMQLREFIAELKRMREGQYHDYSWHTVGECPAIRSVETTAPVPDQSCCHCPITALAEDLTGNIYSPFKVGSAGREIGLSEPAVAHILEAADGSCRIEDVEGAEMLARFTLIKTLREAMLAALGLPSEIEA